MSRSGWWCFGVTAVAWVAVEAWRYLKNDEDIRDSDQGAQAALVGRTPLVRLRSLEALCGYEVEIVAKAEMLNPGGSGKDRLALALVEQAMAKKDCTKVLVEGSSGSTVIALAPLARAAGFEVLAIVPDDVSHEKVQELEALGAKVEKVRAASIASPDHYVNAAKRRASKDTFFFCDQFENSANFRVHERTTGPEIASQCGNRVDAFVAAAGTGGTIAGVSRFFTKKTRIVLADVPGSSLFGKVAFGVCYTAQQSERTLRRHRYDTICDGVGLDRITNNFSKARIHTAISLSDQDALIMAHYLFRFEGLFLGASSAINCLAALAVARAFLKKQDKKKTTHFFSFLPWNKHKNTKRKRVVTVLCDSGTRYLSRFWNKTFIESRGLQWPPNDPQALQDALLHILQDSNIQHLTV